MDVILGFIIFIIVVLIWISAARNGRFQNYGGNEQYWSSSNSYSSYDKYVSYTQRCSNRQVALQKAQLFIKPYKNLMGEHCLANEYVKINLVIEKNGDRKIICINKIVKDKKRKMFTAVINPDFIKYYLQPKDYVVDNLWDSICMEFGYNTVYENISSAAAAAMLSVNEIEIGAAPQKPKTIRTKENLLNINQATEAELLALPGVNIIMAKKALKYIEKTGGFESVEDFIQRMKIKDTFAEQIAAITCVSKSKSEKTEKLNPNEDNFVQKEQPQANLLDFTDNYSKNTKPGNDSDSGRIVDL